MKYAPIVAIPLQAAANINGSNIPTQDVLNVSAQIVVTGAAAGTLTLQASNDNPLSGNTQPTNWSNIPNTLVTVNGAGVYLIPNTMICYEWVRAQYANTGSGTIQVNLKTIGF